MYLFLASSIGRGLGHGVAISAFPWDLMQDTAKEDEASPHRRQQHQLREAKGEPRREATQGSG